MKSKGNCLKLLSLIVLFFTFNTVEADQPGCCSCKSISQSCFKGKHDKDKTFIITKSNSHYCFKEDINFHPSEKAKIAIIVDADYVVIDLCHYKLQQANQNTDGLGIVVKAGRNFVTIINGAVNNFTECGIEFEQANDAITLDRLTFTGNMNLGAIFLGPIVSATNPNLINNYVSNVALTNCRMENNSQGFTIKGAYNILVENCDVFQSLGTGNVGASIIGISSDPTLYTPAEQAAGYAQDVRVSNSTFNNTLSGEAGLGVNSIRNLHLKNCSFNDNTFTGTASGGFVSLGLVNALIEECESNNNTNTADNNVFHSGFVFTGNTATGLDATTGLIIRNCIAIGNTGLSSISGFYLAYQNMLIENCNAVMNSCMSGNTGLYPSAAGFQIISSAGLVGTGSLADDLEGAVNDSVFRDCIATQNIAANGPAAGFMWLGGAFKLDTDVQQNLSFIECEASGNGSLDDSTYAPGVAAGILVDVGILHNVNNNRIAIDGFFPAVSYDSVNVVECYLSGNRTASANGAPYSAGVSFLGVSGGNISNCSSMGNEQGYLLSGGTSWFGQTITTSSHTIVDNNRATSNVGAGFVDVQPSLTMRNVFVNNIAVNNTPTNYSLTGASFSQNNVILP